MLFRGRPNAWTRLALRQCLLAAAAIMAAVTQVKGAELAEAQQLYLSGRYPECIKLAQTGGSGRRRNEEWPVLLVKSMLALGQYSEAETTVGEAIERNPASLRLLLLGHDVNLQNGETNRATELKAEIGQLASTRAWAFRDSAGIVALGEAALLLGADARRVLEGFYNRVKKADPNYRETYLAIGQLALEKYDFELAARTLEEGLAKFQEDPEMLYELARSYSTGERSQMTASLQKALERNERHAPSLLLLADHLIDAEDYAKANEMLDRVLAVNPRDPEAWAYRAVMAHLRNQPAEERQARDTALSRWKNNPRVDQLIGQKLSQKYRFAEGAQYQRRALQSDPTYLPAKGQLAQDLLRLGQEQEGWALAEEVYNQDGYDVLAYNLVTLHDTLARFQVLTNGEFRVRMEPKEAAIYGDRVEDLLGRARRALCAKYGMELKQPVTVEIFPEQKDFAVRTFGMPGGEGFLGVCFGNVITANSPASQAAHSINWESVLWHEFCHVVTLGLTRNKMPRWISEGISVYEERQANPAWGEKITPRYREMILKNELTPVGSLSGAFLAPKTPLHLQFAYYQSSLVIEFLVDSFGLNALKSILGDLAEGVEINKAIEKHTAPLNKIEKDFTAFARARAERMGSALDWGQPQPEDLEKGEEAWIARHPKSFYSLTHQAKRLIRERKWAEAKAPLERLIELYPEFTEGENAYLLLAEAHRGLDETEQEKAVLNKLARLDGNAIQAYQRLMELDSASQDWKAAARDANRFLAVNPLVALPYRTLGMASEQLGLDDDAIQSYRTLLLLDPADPADVHYRLARVLFKKSDPEAKRQVLDALEEAPRFRDAHRLLLQINRAANKTAAQVPEPGPSNQ